MINQVSPAALRWAETHAFSWKLEVEALDKIHSALASAPEGLKLSDLAEATQLGKGYLSGVLHASTCVLKQRPGTYLWYADWNDLEPGFRLDPTKAPCKAPK